MKTLVVYSVFLAFITPLLAQDYCTKLQFCSHAASDINPQQVSTMLSVASIAPIQDIRNAQNLVNRILCLSNSSSVDIDVRGCDCPNAIAVTCTDKKYILFSTDYLLNVLSSGDSSAIYGVFAHEVGHLVRGDAWIGGSKEQRHQSELNADRFAGHILGLLNFPEQTAVATLNAVNEHETGTHPSRSDRIVKIKQGWAQGQNNRNIISIDNLKYIINCKPDNEAPFRIEYTTSKRSILSRYYDVEINIVSGPVIPGTIKNFTYFLHPTSFRNNAVTLYQVKPYTVRIWGSFELRVSVGCEDEHWLFKEYIIGKQIKLSNN